MSQIFETPLRWLRNVIFVPSGEQGGLSVAARHEHERLAPGRKELFDDLALERLEREADERENALEALNV
jgi:hypothetical protein